ncbi:MULTISPECIES: hypothetical protein [Neobacillus]|uniref:Uncharacterized protein n=1 Tax=Neobacillus citreus TaxID=2833578 RepID=A0A942YBQ8_9BACI|nr:hypothetical protein [Neobacillus citreus]MCH6268198.1 hypothetical protein [Neobacillus citreus]
MSGLSSAKAELSSIISELESIEAGLRHDFKGIGSEVAAARIRDFIEECERAKRSLSRVNPSNLSEAFLAKLGIGKG